MPTATSGEPLARRLRSQCHAGPRNLRASAFFLNRHVPTLYSVSDPPRRTSTHAGPSPAITAASAEPRTPSHDSGESAPCRLLFWRSPFLSAPTNAGPWVFLLRRSCSVTHIMELLPRTRLCLTRMYLQENSSSLCSCSGYLV
ncbi:proline-rich receptor-like protein kinase PERK2 [Iris pallida]|uniref:Proline-rich receptor-like protein kinase PERK2 n=1 Tax=Iris pallida TaxID=29817 RepID=A0AAX6GDF8_IRIPA|nr:proline-rich receptor-like protein kinase PERK2 [Iris pallida]